MPTVITEIGPRIYRLSTFVPDQLPGGFTFNQFLIDAEQPLLFHTGMRGLYASVSEAASRVLPLERLRWVSFGHVEADECGSMNSWLAAAPAAQVLHGQVGCMVSLGDLADRPPRPLADGETLDLGGRRVRLYATPHVPHAWEAIVLYEETTRTLFCGDLFTHAGNGPAVIESDVAGPALAFERALPGATALTPATAPTIRRLAALEPATLAVMHGSSFRGDCAAQLRALADGFEAMYRESGAAAG
ncbi:MAG: MBL fold metallo-hydrolase [Lysobacterales bacterium]|jgi:flavorubredoxin|nr:MAG: MBL fold metallo-hydrolase [Xanthomonadales bacterium]